MAEYATEQKKILLQFLREHCESAYTVEELVAGMAELNRTRVPAKSTVYRLMTHLVEEGTVKRFVKGHSRTFLYQIVAGEHCHSHLHLKCMGCGRLIHLDEQTSDALLERVLACSSFAVSEAETVLYGSCADCKHTSAKTEGERHE